MMFCVESARQAGEQLFGNAVEARYWLLIEYRDVWGKHAIEESSLPAEVKTWLAALGHEVRVQFIKQDEPQDPEFGYIAAYIADTNDINPTLYEVRLASYHDLLAIDFSRLDHYPQRVEPLYLVCTNGKRDVVCAKYGIAAYQAIQALAPEGTWQTTHLGGHRFAATALCLPHGLAYGWLDDNAAMLPTTYAAAEILLEHYRGRTSYTPVAQAAEVFLRQHTRDKTITAYHLHHVIQYQHDYWQVSFRETASGQLWHVFGLTYHSDFAVYKSTNDPKPNTVPQFQKLSIYTAAD